MEPPASSPPTRLLPNGIRARLYLLIALVLLPMALLIAWTNYQHFISLRDSKIQSEFEVAQGIATTFEAYINGVREQLSTVGHTIVGLPPGSDHERQLVLRSVTSHISGIRSLNWVSPEGIILSSSSTPELIGQDIARRPYFQEVRNGSSWVISDLHGSGIITRTPLFFLAEAVRDDDNFLLGVVVASIGLEDVGGMTRIRQRPEEGMTTIFDRQGRVVYHSNMGPLTWGQSQRWGAGDPLLARALSSGEAQVGIIKPMMSEGKWLSARVPIESMGWVAGAGRPVFIAYAPVYATLLRDAVLGVFITALAFVLAYFLARTISKPLQRLERDTKRLGEGEGLEGSHPLAPAEVKSLRDSVTAMAANLVAAKIEAEASNRAKSEFLANMSHELRTPMTVIMGTHDFLLERNPEGEQRQLLELASSSANRLLGIIDDLLDISRIEAGRIDIDERPFDLHQSVKEVIDMFAATAQKKRIELRWQAQAQLPETILGDPDRLCQILVNLVGNAVKFTEKGSVSLEVRAEDDHLIFMVSDTGIGIPAQKMDLLFQPFSQVDSSLTRRYGGTGLGLAISKELAGLMGGTIGVRSVEGKGSTFTVKLPFRYAQESERPKATADLPLRPYARTLRILVAEDDPQVREMVTKVLEGRGVDVQVARDGRDAVTISQHQSFDLILMDLQMPLMDGLEATRRIRHLEEEKGRRSRIFALTAHVREEDRVCCEEAGMDGFLTKPLRLEELETLLRTIQNSPQPNEAEEA
jgi:signal transduction histidine kinase/CheY-like chemotaxis protein